MTSRQTAIDGRTFAIGVLSITACILFVGLLLITMTPKPAYAIGESDRGGDYKMVTQQLTNSQEGVIIIDAASRQMMMYAFNGSNKQLQVMQGPVDLTTLPGSRPEQRRNP